MERKKSYGAMTKFVSTLTFEIKLEARENEKQ